MVQHIGRYCTPSMSIDRFCHEPAFPEPAAPRSGSRRRKALTLLLLVFGSIGMAWFLWWFFIDQWREDTDNAYVAGNII